MSSSSYSLVDMDEDGVTRRVLGALGKMTLSSRPLFSVLLVGSAFMFVTFAVMNGNAGAGVTTVGVSNILQVPPPYRHTLEYLRAKVGTTGSGAGSGGGSGALKMPKVQPEDAVQMSSVMDNGTVMSMTSSQNSREQRVHGRNSTPLLTLFTTFKNRKDRWQIHWNVLRNWSLFQPKVRVILFNDRTEQSLLRIARQMNWTILPVPAKSVYGTPILKHMFFTCQKHVPDSMFYGYANGDILFDRGLIDTLEVVGSHLDHLMQSLIIGRRTNFRVRGRQITKMAEVQMLAEKEGKLFRSDAEDYFFLAHNEFPWKAVPNIVIGRPAYDNFLVATARKYAIAMVDATRTLIALHQTGKDGDFAGHRNRDAHYNSRVIGLFDYSKGLTSASQYVTRFTKDGKLELWRRPGIEVSAMLLTPATPVTVPTNVSVNVPEVNQGGSMWLGNAINNNTNNNNNKTDTDTSEYSLGQVSKEAKNIPQVVGNHTNQTAQADRIMPVAEDIGLFPNGSNATDTPIEDLLTLFTVFSPNVVLQDIHFNVIRNWAAFHPNVATVLFAPLTGGDLEEVARKLNWTVLPRLPQTSKVLPLKRMFLQVQQIFPNSKFYGYLNGDLVFGEGLVKTVTAIYQTLEELDNALLIGVKNRYLISDGQHLFDPAEVSDIVKVKAAHIHPDFDENFLLAHYMFPWQHIPDLVIGRSVYDNYLVALALRHEFAVIDSTRTLIALDQLTSDTTLVQGELEDFDPNLLGALDYTSGFASSAQYETSWGEDGGVRLWKRNKGGRKSLVVASNHRK